jgi:hypothetical protein
MTIENKKLRLITEIALLNDEIILDRYAKLLSKANYPAAEKKVKPTVSLAEVTRPMRDVIDIDMLKKEQNWQPTTREEIREIAQAMDIQESYEDLLKML